MQSHQMNGAEKTLPVMREWREDARLRYVGITTSDTATHPRMVELMNKEPMDFIQVNYSLVEPVAAERLLPLAKDKGVAVTINRPFQNGNFFSLIRDHELPEWAAEFDCESWAQFSLKFILANSAVNCVLTETANPKHAVDNLGAGFGRLPDESEQQKMLEHIRNLI